MIARDAIRHTGWLRGLILTRQSLQRTCLKGGPARPALARLSCLVLWHRPLGRGLVAPLLGRLLRVHIPFGLE